MLLSWHGHGALVLWTPHHLVLYRPAAGYKLKESLILKKQAPVLRVIVPKVDVFAQYTSERLPQVILDSLKIPFPLIFDRLPPSPLDVLRARAKSTAPVTDTASPIRRHLLITYPADSPTLAVEDQDIDVVRDDDQGHVAADRPDESGGNSQAVAETVLPSALGTDDAVPSPHTPERLSPVPNKTSVGRNIFVKRKNPAEVDDDSVAPSSSSPSVPAASKKRRTRLGITLRPATKGASSPLQHDGPHQEDSPSRAAASNDENSKIPAKRTLGESIADSARRVLKKPFKPPTLQCGSHTAPTRPKRDFASAPAPINVSTRSSSPPFPDFKPRRIPAMRPPRQITSDLASSPSTSSRTSNSGPSRPRSQIVQLERTVHQLRQAVKYSLDPTEDERLEELVGIWRQAGRDAVENLFSIIPPPEPSSYVEQRRSGQWQASGPSTWGWDDRENALTDAEREYLRHAPRNADGDPVDAHGNLLLPSSGADDLFKMLAEGARERCGTGAYRPLGIHAVSSFDARGSVSSGVEEGQAAGPAKWDYGALMRQCSVDPALLGWDEEAEDWTIV